MRRKASLFEPTRGGFGPRLLADLVQRPIWLIGFAGLVASFVLQAVALGLGQLSAVETVITLEVPLTLLVASPALDPRPGDEIGVSHTTYAAAGSTTAAAIAALILAARRGHRTLLCVSSGHGGGERSIEFAGHVALDGAADFAA
jgi:hypothetical protein